MSENTTTDPLQYLGSQLLTGILNDVTLTEIVPKLPWRDSHLLRTVSKDWQRAFWSGMVYDARVSCKATEKLSLAVCYFYPGFNQPQSYRIYLHCRSQDCWYKLPPIPGVPSGLPYDCECVPLNGKIYVLGGRIHPSDQSGIKQVYMLDLSGQESQWKQCKCKQVPRLRCGVSVMDGKIFMFGGDSGGRIINRREKYDPKVDVWSELQPSIRRTVILRNFVAVGKDLFLFQQDGKRFEGFDFLPDILLGDDSSDDDDSSDVDNDSSDDDDSSDVDDDSSDNTEDPFLSEHYLDDQLDDVTWIKMIDPGLFRDNDSGDLQWFREDIKKHGFHQIIESELGMHNFDEAIEIGGLGNRDDEADLNSYLAHDIGQDKRREGENLSTDRLYSIRLLGRPMKAPYHSFWSSGDNPFCFVDTNVWPLNL